MIIPQLLQIFALVELLMNRTTVYTKPLLVLGLATAVLAACTTTNDPTPQAPLAEVVTVTVERPSATATLAPSSTPTATFEVDTESLTLIASSTEE